MISIHDGLNQELQESIYDGIDEDIDYLQSLVERAESSEITGEEFGELACLLPVYAAGLSSLNAIVGTTFQWQAQNNLTGSVYQPITNSGNIIKKYQLGTSDTNNTSGGADQIFSFQQGVPANSSATVDLTAMTNLLGQAAVTIARFKSYQIRLLSADDDPTISPAPNTGSQAVISNMGNVANVTALDFGTGGSGLTLLASVLAGALNTVSLCTAGSGYPRSKTFLVCPSVAGGSGGVVAVTTNTTGVPTGTPSVVAGGAGYTNTAVNTTVLGQYMLNDGDAHLSINITNTGIPLSSTSKNLVIENVDTVNAITVELDFPGAST